MTPVGKHDCSNKASFPFISSSNRIFGIILYHAVPTFVKHITNILHLINIKIKLNLSGTLV